MNENAFGNQDDNDLSDLQNSANTIWLLEVSELGVTAVDSLFDRLVAEVNSVESKIDSHVVAAMITALDMAVVPLEESKGNKRMIGKFLSAKAALAAASAVILTGTAAAAATGALPSAVQNVMSLTAASVGIHLPDPSTTSDVSLSSSSSASSTSTSQPSTDVSKPPLVAGSTITVGANLKVVDTHASATGVANGEVFDSTKSVGSSAANDSTACATLTPGVAPSSASPSAETCGTDHAVAGTDTNTESTSATSDATAETTETSTTTAASVTSTSTDSSPDVSASSNGSTDSSATSSGVSSGLSTTVSGSVTSGN